MKKLIGVTIAISLAIIAMQSFAVPSLASEGNAGYNATVLSGQNTFVQSVNGTFGTILVGNSKVIDLSIVLNNIGDLNATVDAKFSTNVSGLYGLVNNTDVIGASNFSLAKAGSSWVPLSNAGDDVRITSAQFGTQTNLNASLAVPNVPGGAYTGTVLLTFGNEV
jgi:hypothetical protein